MPGRRHYLTILHACGGQKPPHACQHLATEHIWSSTVGCRRTGLDTSNITRNAVCRDALASDNLPEVRADCLALLKSSQQTSWTLNLLNRTSDCALCSAEDLWFELHNNTQVFIEIAANPGHVLFVLSRHGPTRYIRTGFRAAMQVLEVLAHSTTADTAYFNSSSLALRSAWDWLSPLPVNLTVTNRSQHRQVDQNIVQEF